MQKGFSQLIILLGILLISLIGGGVYYFNSVKTSKDITDFASCAKAGNPVLESYPAQCSTKDGKHFIQQLSEEEKKKLIPPKDGQVCIQVITPAKNLKTSECKEFSTPCDVPEGWNNVSSCNSDVMSDGANSSP